MVSSLSKVKYQWHCERERGGLERLFEKLAPFQPYLSYTSASSISRNCRLIRRHNIWNTMCSKKNAIPNCRMVFIYLSLLGSEIANGRVKRLVGAHPPITTQLQQQQQPPENNTFIKRICFQNDSASKMAIEFPKQESEQQFLGIFWFVCVMCRCWQLLTEFRCAFLCVCAQVASVSVIMPKICS